MQPKAATQEELQISTVERGAKRDGIAQEMDRRLFMQLVVFRFGGGEGFQEQLRQELEERKLGAVLYAHVNDPHGYGLLGWSTDPAQLATDFRSVFQEGSLRAATITPTMNMIGRSYSVGYEADLEYWLIRKPVETVLNTDWPWAVWYPLRRKGAFAQLDRAQQGKILGEHALLGKAYGKQDLAHDVRLACHGLDQADNDFVIGLIGKELHPLSHVVQTMRKTKQTSEYIEQMGPFFLGRAVLRSQGA